MHQAQASPFNSVKRVAELSSCWAVRLSGFRAFGLFSCLAVGLFGLPSCEPNRLSYKSSCVACAALSLSMSRCRLLAVSVVGCVVGVGLHSKSHSHSKSQLSLAGSQKTHTATRIRRASQVTRELAQFRATRLTGFCLFGLECRFLSNAGQVGSLAGSLAGSLSGQPASQLACQTAASQPVYLSIYVCICLSACLSLYLYLCIRVCELDSVSSAADSAERVDKSAL